MAHESLLLPAQTVVCFPRADFDAPSADVYPVTVALADLALPTLNAARGRTGFVRVFHSTALAYFLGSALPENYDELLALAEEMARSWFLHSVPRAEVALSGVQPWLPSGLDGVVEWDHSGDMIVTRARPRPWWDGPDDLFHHGHYGSASAPTYSSGVTMVGGAVALRDTRVSIGGRSTLQVGGPEAFLLEDGSAFLLEDGSPLFVDASVTLLQSNVTVLGPTPFLLEDGTAFLLEDGSAFLLEDGGDFVITGDGKLTVGVTLEVCGPVQECQEEVTFTVTGTLTPPDAPVALITVPNPGQSITNVLPPADPTAPATFTLIVAGPEDVTLVAGPNVQLPFDITLTADYPLELAWDVVEAAWVPKGGTGINHVMPPGSAVYLPEVSAPGTPAAGYGALYPKADGVLYWKDDAGNESVVGGGGFGWTLARTITHDDLTDADTIQDISVSTLPARGAIHAVQIITNEAGVAASLVTLDIGVLVDGGLVGMQGDGLVADNVAGRWLASTGEPPVIKGGATTPIAVKFESSGADLVDLTAGEWEVWILTAQL